jgi:hypothetical protein
MLCALVMEAKILFGFRENPSIALRVTKPKRLQRTARAAGNARNKDNHSHKKKPDFSARHTQMNAFFIF